MDTLRGAPNGRRQRGKVSGKASEPRVQNWRRCSLSALAWPWGRCLHERERQPGHTGPEALALRSPTCWVGSCTSWMPPDILHPGRLTCLSSLTLKIMMTVMINISLSLALKSGFVPSLLMHSRPSFFAESWAIKKAVQKVYLVWLQISPEMGRSLLWTIPPWGYPGQGSRHTPQCSTLQLAPI